MLTELQGQIERITYANDETGYTVAKLKVSGKRDLVTVVRNFMAPMPGETLRMKGEWANHPKYENVHHILINTSTSPARPKIQFRPVLIPAANSNSRKKSTGSFVSRTRTLSDPSSPRSK